MRYARLLELNALPDAPLAEDRFVYLEKGGRPVADAASDAAAQAPVAAAVADDRVAVTHTYPAAQAVPVTAEVQKAVLVTHVPPAAVTAAVKEPVVAAPVPPQAQVTAPVAVNVIPAAAPVNIANETAVEEQKPAAPKQAEEPQDDFSRLKAKLDRVVYAQNTHPAPVTKSSAATPQQQSPVVAQAAKPATDTAVLPATHTVKEGETAFGIAREHNISVKQLMEWNNLSGFQKIQVGQKLRVR